MHGYWKNDEATADAIDADGWFHTGDLGEFDADGFIKITGRKKEILVTAGGKNVAPAVLEDRIRLHPLVSQCMVVGDGKPFIAALITIDPETIVPWATERGKPTDPAALTQDAKDLIAEMQKAIDDANAAVSQGRGDQEVHDPPDRLDPGDRRAVAETLAAPPHRDGEPRHRRRGALHQVGSTPGITRMADAGTSSSGDVGAVRRPPGFGV